MRNDFETNLSAAEQRDLRCLAGRMIPASETFGVPGANDEAIFADILRSLGRDLGDVRRALAELATQTGGAFAELDEPRATAEAETFWTRASPAMTVLGRTVLQCYYRDDRVVRSLGLDPRPPFPKGHTLAQGDWSLLDPVRARPRLWRDAP